MQNKNNDKFYEEQMIETYRSYEKAKDSDKGPMLWKMAKFVKEKPYLYEYVPITIKNDLSANNEFYKETRRINDITERNVKINESSIYTRDEINQLELIKNLKVFRVNDDRAEANRLQREAAIRREKTKKKADALRPEYAKNMLDLSQKWVDLRQNSALSEVMNIALTKKMMNIVKVVPDTYEMIPSEIRNSPGLNIARPFYDESRNFLKKNAQDVSDIMIDPKDGRRPSVARLITETNRDEALRKDPKKAMEYNRLLMQRPTDATKAPSGPQINNNGKADNTLTEMNKSSVKEPIQKKTSPKNIYDEMSR